MFGLFSSDKKLTRTFDFLAVYIEFSFEKTGTIMSSLKGRFYRFSSRKCFRVASLYHIHFSFSHFSDLHSRAKMYSPNFRCLNAEFLLCFTPNCEMCELKANI